MGSRTSRGTPLSSTTLHPGSGSYLGPQVCQPATEVDMWDQTSPRDPGEPRQLQVSAYCIVKLKSQAGKRKTASRVQGPRP